MNLDQILHAVNDLSSEEREQLRAYLTERETEAHPKPRTVEEWLANFERIARDFKGESSDEEMSEIIQAINTKSKPSEKGL